MNKFRALLVINLKAMLLTSTGRRGTKKGRAVSGLGALAIMGFLALYLSGTYSFTFAAQLSQVGMVDLLLMMMPVLVVAMGVLYTVMAVQGVVFGGKDNDLMLSLPVSAFLLMLSRVTALVLENLVFSLLVMAPAGVAYAVFGPGAGAAFFLRLLAASLLLALLPTTLALLLGCLLTWLSARFTRGKTLARSLLYLVFLGAVMALSFRAGLLVNTLAEYAAGIRAGFAGWGLPFLLFQQGVCGDALAFLAFAGLCVIPFLLCVWLFGLRYKRLVTALSARSSRSDYRLGRQSAAGAGKALLAKEARRFFGTTMYFVNCGFGLLLLLVLGGALLVKGGGLTALLALADGLLPAGPLLALCMVFCLSTAAVSAVSISLEGKYLWILKEAPVPAAAVLRTKWLFQLLLTLPCLLAAWLCAMIGLRGALALPEGLAALAVCAAFAVFHALFGVWINLCFPRLDAPNDTVVVKQSMASFLGVFLPMACLLPGAGLWLLLHKTLGSGLVLLFIALLLLAAAAVFYRLLERRGPARLLELG